MTTPVTTARALEVCLSRVPMYPQMASALAAALTRERAQPTESPVRDPDEIAARLQVVLYALEGCDENFSKNALLVRIADARWELRNILGVTR